MRRPQEDDRRKRREDCGKREEAAVRSFGKEVFHRRRSKTQEGDVGLWSAESFTKHLSYLLQRLDPLLQQPVFCA